MKAEQSSVLFEGVVLSGEIRRAFVEFYPKHVFSSVEQKCLPKAMNNTNIICESNETEGAVQVVALSVLEMVKREMQRSIATNQTPTPLAVVLCNTRPLAVRVGQIFQDLAKYTNIIPLTLCGTVSISANKKVLSTTKPHVIVGTPARISQLCEDKMLSMANVKHFVVMNAEKALEFLDTRRDIQQILVKTPKKKHVMIFGSKLSTKTNQVCNKFMKEEPFKYSDFSETDPESAEIDIMT